MKDDSTKNVPFWVHILQVSPQENQLNEDKSESKQTDEDAFYVDLEQKVTSLPPPKQSKEKTEQKDKEFLVDPSAPLFNPLSKFCCN